MDVQKITSDEYQEVEQYIALSHSATGFHSPGWIHVLGNAFNVKPLFLRSRDGDGNINGLLPLFRSKSLLFGDFICSLEDGHCAENHDAAQALSRCANELLSVEGAKYLNYKTNFTQPTAQDGIAPFDTQVVETVKTVVSTDIDSEKLFSSLSSNTRRKVRKASREGYTVNNSVKHLEH